MTVKDYKEGQELEAPIYVHKPYVILSQDNVTLWAGSEEEMKTSSALSIAIENGYYDKCIIQARDSDLYLNDNTKIEDTQEEEQVEKLLLILAPTDGWTQSNQTKIRNKIKKSASKDDIKRYGLDAQNLAGDKGKHVPIYDNGCSRYSLFAWTHREANQDICNVYTFDAYMSIKNFN